MQNVRLGPIRASNLLQLSTIKWLFFARIRLVGVLVACRYLGCVSSAPLVNEQNDTRCITLLRRTLNNATMVIKLFVSFILLKTSIKTGANIKPVIDRYSDIAFVPMSHHMLECDRISNYDVQISGQHYTYSTYSSLSSDALFGLAVAVAYAPIAADGAR